MPLLGTDSKDTDRRLCSQMCVCAAVLTLPPGIEHPANVADAIHYLAFVVLFGVVAYLGTFWVLWTTTRILVFGYASYRTMHRASTVFGVAAVLCLPTIGFAFIIPPGNILGVTVVGLMIAFAVTAFVIAIRILRKGDSSSGGR